MRTLLILTEASIPLLVSPVREAVHVRTIAGFEVSDDLDTTDLTNEVRATSIEMLSAPDISHLSIVRSKVVPIGT